MPGLPAAAAAVVEAGPGAKAAVKPCVARRHSAVVAERQPIVQPTVAEAAWCLTAARAANSPAADRNRATAIISPAVPTSAAGESTRCRPAAWWRSRSGQRSTSWRWKPTRPTPGNGKSPRRRGRRRAMGGHRQSSEVVPDRAEAANACPAPAIVRIGRVAPAKAEPANGGRERVIVPIGRRDLVRVAAASVGQTPTIGPIARRFLDRGAVENAGQTTAIDRTGKTGRDRVVAASDGPTESARLRQSPQHRRPDEHWRPHQYRQSHQHQQRQPRRYQRQ